MSKIIWLGGDMIMGLGAKLKALNIQIAETLGEPFKTDGGGNGVLVKDKWKNWANSPAHAIELLSKIPDFSIYPCIKRGKFYFCGKLFQNDKVRYIITKKSFSQLISLMYIKYINLLGSKN